MVRRYKYITILLALLLIAAEANAVVTYHILTLPFTTYKNDGTANYSNIRVEALRCTSNDLTVGLPEDYKSPLAQNFVYYAASDVTKSANRVKIYANNNTSFDTYTIAVSPTPLSEGTAITDGSDIYVIYDYNASNGIFQARGDSRHPLYYLMIASATNVALDLLFVKVLGFGIVGAAAATAISQFLSAFISLMKLTHVDDVHRVTIRDIGFDRPLLGEILKTGLPTGVQNSVIGLANVIVQSNINAFGSDAMAGCGAYFKVEGFAFLPVTSFSVALTTFTSQNLGARRYDRVKKGARFGLASGVLLAELVGVLFILFAPRLIGLFTNSPEVVAYGVKQARTETLFYCLLSFSHCMAGIIRGAGKTTVPMLVMLICWCLIRVTYISVIVKLVPDITVIFWAYPITWTLSSICFAVYYLKADWIHNFERQEQRRANA